MTTQPKPGLLYKATYSLVFHTLSVRNKAVTNVASALTDVIAGARDACSLSRQNRSTETLERAPENPERAPENWEKDLRAVTIEREPTLEEYVLEYKPA